MTIEPRIPLGLWWALAVAAVVAIAFYALRRDWPIGTRWRIVVIGCLGLGVIGPLLIALNPIWIEPVPPLPGKPRITVLVDGTTSMNVEDAGPARPQSRWQRSLELTEPVGAEEGSVEVHKMTFDDAPVPLPDVDDETIDWPRGHRTDLAGVLRETIRSGSPQGHAVLLISDGAHNAGSAHGVLAAAQEANSLATPIYTLTLGSEVGTKNLSLTARNPRMIAFPENPLALHVRVAHHGLAGQQARVHWFRDEERLETRTVRLTGEPYQALRFELPEAPQSKLQRYRFVAEEVAGEVTSADNQTTVLVQRLEAPIQVLILEGKPYWDSKFLSRNLGSDPVVALSSITRLGPERFLQRHLSQPGRQSDDDSSTSSDDWGIQTALESPLERMELLEDYRLVILGRDAESFLTPEAIENLRQWIARSGGCLLCARGAPSDQIASKLATILPVRWSASERARFRTRLSQYGVDAAVFDSLLSEGSDPLATLPSLASDAVPVPRSGLPQVLIQSVVDSTGTSIPVVTYQPYGSGQTIVVEGAGMWRWAFLPPEHANKDEIYPTLWQSLIQWVVSQQDLMPGQQVAIRPDRASFMAGDRVTASILVKDPALLVDDQGRPDLTVLLQPADDQLPQRIAPAASGLDEAVFRVDFDALPVGYYTASVVRGEDDEVLSETAIEVRDPWFESLEVDARPDLMRRIARLSGGEVLQAGDVTGLAQRFEQRLQKERPTKMIRTPIWDRPMILLLILAGWIGTWIVRRRIGLI